MRWLLLLLMVALPLQWFVVGGGLRLHMAAMYLFTIVVVAAHRRRAFRPVTTVALPFVAANVVLCGVWLATNFYNGLGFRQPVEQLANILVMVGVGTVVYRGVVLGGSRLVETMRWAGLATSASLLVAMSISMSANGVNPAEVFASTLSAADPEVLQKELFQSAFNGFGLNEDVVRGNIRHEVFGAAVVAMCLASACVGLRPFSSRPALYLYRFSLALTVALLVVSMSRSIMLAAAGWPLLALLRALLAGRLAPRVVGGVVLAAGLTGVLALIGLANVLWVRFTEDTGSYEARDRLMETAFRNIVENMLTGGVATGGQSSHNFVIDTWLRSGIFGAAAALVAVTLVVGLLFRLAVNLHREPGWMLPVAALLLLPVVRMFTAGGGLIPPVSWVALGVAAGFMAYRVHIVAKPSEDRSHPLPQPQPQPGPPVLQATAPQR